MNVQNFCVKETDLICDAIKILDAMGKRVVFVTEGSKLKGVVTDGDFRRWILKGGDLEDKVSEMMCTTPISIKTYERFKANYIFKSKSIFALPVIDEANNIVDIIFYDDSRLDDIQKNNALENIPVVIMAGGKGTRLYPYTKIIPKPLIPIGDKTILEHIIDKFKNYGVREFYITINYKKNMIKAYLDEQAKDINIHYIEEEEFLGTAGSLFMLKDKIKGTFFLSNCDILVEANYEKLLNYHKKNNNKITVVTSLKQYTIPYGIMETEFGKITRLREKPEYNFQVNTGVYVLDSSIIADIPINKFYHITELIADYIKCGKAVGAYPITSNAWMDMGEIKEMENMIARINSQGE